MVEKRTIYYILSVVKYLNGSCHTETVIYNPTKVLWYITYFSMKYVANSSLNMLNCFADIVVTHIHKQKYLFRYYLTNSSLTNKY